MMISHTNKLTVPEVTAYSKERIDGGVLIHYLVRDPGEMAWRAVRLFRPDEPAADEAVASEAVANERQGEKTR
jgi:hypothetical protein